MAKSEITSEPRFEATVVATERITPDGVDEVRELILDIDRSECPYRVGESIGVLAPRPPGGEHDHHRLYSVADLPQRGSAGKPRITIRVVPHSYVDEAGRLRRGVASNYLCDLRPAGRLWTTGPFGPAFDVPAALNANLLLIASGPGIAPFRALVTHIYEHVPRWTGRVWLFHGGPTGLELLYRNDPWSDLARYIDQRTFTAIRELSPRPRRADPIARDRDITRRGWEVWKMLADPTTVVYLAGFEAMRARLDAVFTPFAGTSDRWGRLKSGLMAAGRWVELLY